MLVEHCDCCDIAESKDMELVEYRYSEGRSFDGAEWSDDSTIYFFCKDKCWASLVRFCDKNGYDIKDDTRQKRAVKEWIKKRLSKRFKGERVRF